MTMSTLLIIVLLVILVGALPTWPHSRSWGYYPSGGLGLILLVIIILLAARPYLGINGRAIIDHEAAREQRFVAVEK